MSTLTPLPAGVRAPLATDNDDDHSGLIVVITSFYVVLILASLSARVFSLSRKHFVQKDDYVFAVLVVISIVQASVVLAQVDFGWGTRYGPSTSQAEDRMLKLGYAADILSVVALGLSKISTCLFYQALFSQVRRRLIQGILVASTVWTLVSLFLLAVRCNDHPWYDISDRCSGLLPRWQAITAFDIVTEVLLIVFSGYAIHKVHIPARKKALVFLALGCRAALIPLSALRIHYTHAQLTSRYPILDGAYATTTTEIYLSLSIVCQVTSSLKFIIAVYEDKDGVSYTDGSAKGTFKSKIPVSTDSSSHKHRSVSVSAGDRVRLVDAERGEGVETGTASGGLQILRSVSVQWSVRDEGIELDERDVAGTRVFE
ncbi:hypothetical protein BJY04DRAFT_41449 [Aspergillus karnatakaensis]|uniref:uncharacterized protein n=1 Tax=Aspergillus karnatakaensis TaxID=1810916 RepID=UPI003CCE377E